MDDLAKGVGKNEFALLQVARRASLPSSASGCSFCIPVDGGRCMAHIRRNRVDGERERDWEVCETPG